MVKKKSVKKTDFKYGDGDYFEVEKICGDKIENNTKYYNVKWLGWPITTNTWEPLENLKNVKHLVKQYEIDKNGIMGSELESESELEFAEDDSIADIAKDNILRIIKMEFNTNIGKHLATIEWCIRKNGFKPSNSKIDRELLRNKAPMLLIDYYESRIKWAK